MGFVEYDFEKKCFHENLEATRRIQDPPKGKLFFIKHVNNALAGDFNKMIC